MVCSRATSPVSRPRHINGVPRKASTTKRVRSGETARGEASHRARQRLISSGRSAGSSSPPTAYLDRSILPGPSALLARRIQGSLSDWLTKANSSVHGTIRWRPSDRIPEQLGSMLALHGAPNSRHDYGERLWRLAGPIAGSADG